MRKFQLIELHGESDILKHFFFKNPVFFVKLHKESDDEYVIRFIGEKSKKELITAPITNLETVLFRLERKEKYFKIETRSSIYEIFEI